MTHFNLTGLTLQPCPHFKTRRLSYFNFVFQYALRVSKKDQVYLFELENAIIKKIDLEVLVSN